MARPAHGLLQYFFLPRRRSTENTLPHDGQVQDENLPPLHWV